jgi:hypothetical protein
MTTLCALCNEPALPSSKYCQACRDKPGRKPYYTFDTPKGAIELEDLLKAKGWYEGFYAGNALKYLLRHDTKSAPQADLEKARFCINQLLGDSQ